VVAPLRRLPSWLTRAEFIADESSAKLVTVEEMELLSWAIPRQELSACRSITTLIPACKELLFPDAEGPAMIPCSGV